MARLAARQWGVVDVDDLRACGLSDKAIHVRVAAGRLHPLYRGVYAVGHPTISLRGRCLAAVKACGAGAVISHFAAAFLWGMLEPFDCLPRHHRAEANKSHPSINTHRAKNIDATTLHGIPVTTPIQTLIHLSAILPFKTLRRAVNEALNRRLITPEQLVTTHHRGAKKLRSILATAAPTRSENENLALHLLHEAGIAKPLVNPRIAAAARSRTSCGPTSTSSWKPTAGATTTIRWPAPTTRDKQRILEALGYTVIRTSWAEMTTRPDRMITRVQRELTRVDPPAALVLRSA